MARKDTKKRSPRTSWKGYLKVDLVSFPVEAFNAVVSGGGDIHFNQLHAKCHRRIQYQKVCPIHGEVSNDEIVSGYEYRKGKYIEVDPEELDKLRSNADRALAIDTFVEPEAIDPIYLDGRHYYLVPDGKEAEEPYAVLCAAMQRMDRYGIGEIIFSEKEQLVLIRPVDGALTMAMLHQEREIKSVADLGIKLPKVTGKKVDLARSVIKAATEDSFDFSEYKDRYNERVQRLIDAKVKGEEIVAPEEEEVEETKVINLMDALRRSIEKAKPGKRKPARSKPKRRTNTKRRKVS